MSSKQVHYEQIFAFTLSLPDVMASLNNIPHTLAIHRSFVMLHITYFSFIFTHLQMNAHSIELTPTHHAHVNWPLSLLNMKYKMQFDVLTQMKEKKRRMHAVQLN